ncbi:MAG TPA: type VI secretion system tube protein Hcp [Terracidiphilus sp.]|jgi:type VI protein secretion system component Hcp
MKLRLPWIACVLLAAVGHAHAGTTAIVSFGPSAPRCALPDDTWLSLPACPTNSAFEAFSYSWGASTSGARVSLSTLNLTKAVDSTSAPLLMSMLGAHPISFVRISFYSTDAAVPGNTINPLYELLLSNVYVSGVETGDNAGGGPPIQSITLAFGRISVRVVTLHPDGTVALQTVVGYDQTTESIF